VNSLVNADGELAHTTPGEGVLALSSASLLVLRAVLRALLVQTVHPTPIKLKLRVRAASRNARAVHPSFFLRPNGMSQQ
jgi:hypothetical protein